MRRVACTLPLIMHVLYTINFVVPVAIYMTWIVMYRCVGPFTTGISKTISYIAMVFFREVAQLTPIPLIMDYNTSYSS